MAPTGAVWAPLALRLLRQAFNKTSKLVKARLEQVSRNVANSELQPVLVRNAPRQPISRAAAIRQSKGRWYTTHSTINASIRRFMSTNSQVVRIDRASFPKSATATAINRLTSRAPFASTLRPNLTGGAMPRTAGGYSLGAGRNGGVRHFSHTPAAPAQVVNNVSAAVRAFWLSGNKAQFDGITPAGEKRYRSVSNLQAEMTSKMQSISKFAPGSYIDFQVSPQITALSPLSAQFPFAQATTISASNPTLNTSGFLDVLSVDFGRALKDLAATMNDLKKLSTLGDLSISLAGPSTLRIRFPGCDAETVENLCAEVNVTRGIIHQDADFERCIGTDVALLFPFAPSSEHTLSSPGGSMREQTGFEADAEYELYREPDNYGSNPWVHSPEGYASIGDDLSETESLFFSDLPAKKSAARPRSAGLSVASVSEYEGLEGIYKFLEQCDTARRI